MKGHSRQLTRVKSSDPGGVGTARGWSPGRTGFYSPRSTPPGRGSKRGAGAWRLRLLSSRPPEDNSALWWASWRPRDRRAHQWSDGRADPDRRGQVTNQNPSLRGHTNTMAAKRRELRLPQETLIVASRRPRRSCRGFEREKQLLLPTVGNDDGVRRCTTTPPGTWSSMSTWNWILGGRVVELHPLRSRQYARRHRRFRAEARVAGRAPDPG